jgi:type I restriction enzyme, S subunit
MTTKMKKTAIGEIPEDWELLRFDSLARIEEGQVLPTELPYLDYFHIGPDNITSGSGRLTELQTARALNLTSGKYLFDKESIVYSKIRPNLNKVCMPDFTGICSADAYPLWPKDNKVTRDYLFHYMLSPFFVRQATEMSMRTGLPKINRSELSQIKIVVPPTREQSRISNILDVWEKVAEEIENLLSAKRTLKKALMQQLLTGKRRFKEFKEPWRKVRISEVLEEVSRPIAFNDEVLYELISVRRRSGGIFSRENLYGREILTKNLYTAKAGDFLISKMQVVHGALGLVTPEFDGKAISGSYIAMVSKNLKVLNIEFFNYLSQMPLMYRLAYISSYGVHIEKMTFNLELFLKEKILIPPTAEEQGRIVSVIDAAQREIQVLETQLEAIKLQKRGLMQKLLTGKVRVNVSSEKANKGESR